VHEAIKVRAKILKDTTNFEADAIAALEADPKRNFMISKVENLHKRLLKTGSTGSALKTKAQDLFKLSKYFTA
jgi:hypothetical protein